jgi:hypothetical protein
MLTSANLVIQQNQVLAGKEGKMGTLAQLLAKETRVERTASAREYPPKSGRECAVIAR